MDDTAHLSGITFNDCHLGLHNGTRAGSLRMGVEMTSRCWNGDTPLHYAENIEFINTTIEPCDETCLDIESPEQPSPVVGNFRIEGCSLLGGGMVADAQWGQSLCLEIGQGAVVKDNLILGGKYGALEVWSDGNPAALSFAQITGNVIDATQGRKPVTQAVNLTAAQTTLTGNTITVDEGTPAIVVTGDNCVTSPNTVNGEAV